MLRKIRRNLGPEVGENFIMSNLITCTLLPSIIGMTKSGGLDGQGM
jgi:hypothetical protein